MKQSKNAVYNTSKMQSKLPLISQSMFNKIVEQMDTAYEEHSIPAFHRSYFKDCIYQLKPQMAVPLVSKEIDDLKNNRSIIKAASYFVNQREDLILCLSNIGKTMKGKVDQELLKDCMDLLHKLRILSLNTVEAISQWREYLKIVQSNVNNSKSINQPVGNHKSDKDYIYLLGNQNYLLKMKVDTNFLCQS